MSFKDWTTYKLGDVADIQNGYAFKSNEFATSGIPVIKIKNIVSPNISLDDAQCFDGKITDRLKQFFIKRNDILISMTGSHLNQIASAVGKVGRYQFDYPALLNQRVGKVYVKDARVFNETYLYYFLNRLETQIELVSSAGGSANQANISPSQIKNLKITAPDLDTQTRIASILSSLDDKIELNRQTNQTLEVVAQTLFKEMCVPKSEELPGGWRMEKLDSVSLLITKGTTPTTYGDKFVDYGVNFLRVDCILDSENINLTKALFIDQSTHEKLRRSQLRENDILVTIAGSIGRIGLVTTRVLPANTNQAIALVRVNPTLVSSLYVYCFFKDKSTKERLLSGITQSVQANISLADLKNLDIILPTPEVLERFEKSVAPLMEMYELLTQETQTLIDLRDSLLPKLMKGEIEVKEAL
jgi:type I restriction enzyme S subunit